jgi:hypothetical protein
MGKKALKKKQQAAAKATRAPKEIVKVTSVMGDPSIEEIENGRQIVLWMYVEGHGRIKVQSSSPGVYHASAADPSAGSAAEAGAGAYCEQHGEELRQLYGRLV